ncbi:MAG TPA: type II secretion system protein GspM [Bryobacteraceae bacterium]|nr:type II secretion system protein GspM [Bryobacteraceae bacterium]
MTITGRDKRALMILGGAIALAAVYVAFTWTPSTAPVAAVKSISSIPEAEQRLDSMRRSMARIPGKAEVLKQAQAELASRERGLIQADTANQAQAQVLDIITTLAKAQGVEIRSKELSVPRPYGDAYGEVTVGVAFECRIEQLVNLLADLSNRSELVATNDLQISAANPKQKTITVRLRISGVVPRRLVPEKKDAAV